MQKQALSETGVLEKELLEREAEIALLKDIFETVGAELDLDKIYSLVASQALNLLQAETILIPVVDKDCETYTYRGGAGHNIEEVLGESLPVDYGLCGWVWKKKQAWWQGMLGELSPEERKRWQDHIGNVILVPLIGKESFLGGIAGFNKCNGQDFNQRDFHLLSLFASMVAISIEKAMSVEETRKANQLAASYQKQLSQLNSKLIENNHELEQLSLYDGLTRLPNRALFQDRLAQQLSVLDAGNNLALLLFDIQEFKKINDAFGLERGDQLIQQVVERLQYNIHPGETLARLGGDEFIMLLPDVDLPRALERAHTVQSQMFPAFSIAEEDICIHVRIGIVLAPEQGKDSNILFRHLDLTMLEAKNHHHSILVYEEQFCQKSLSPGQLALVGDVHKALENNDFELYYQPKIQLSDHSLIGMEALGRWNHSERGFVPPGIFIDILQQGGLIDKYTLWAIERALKDMEQWNNDGHNFKIAVNISTTTLLNPGFCEQLEAIKKGFIGFENLILEITENVFLSEYGHLSKILEKISDCGITLSLDDFGTGYSSLSRLKKLPFRELKVDQSFIRGMENNREDEIIVRSTVELAHNLGLKVVAEGVEDAKTLYRLQQLECDVIQGYHISKPMPKSDMSRFIVGFLAQDLVEEPDRLPLEQTDDSVTGV